MTFGLKQGDKFAFHPEMDPETYLMDQLWEQYTPAQHELFNALCQRQLEILPGRAHDDYIDYIEQMGFDKPIGIPKFEEINKVLYKATGWKIAAVPGLLPDDIFFGHLADRVFPVTFWLRDPNESKYLPEPDLFHDLFGHVPMLMNPFIADYMQAYGKGGLKASEIEEGLQKITRLYWYTIEFGLINTTEGLRIYGAGILSSETESKYSVGSLRPHRVKFDIRRIMQTDYRYFDLQDTYFVIDSFEQLVKQTKEDFTPYYTDLLNHPVIDPVNLMIGDKIITNGSVEEE